MQRVGAGDAGARARRPVGRRASACVPHRRQPVSVAPQPRLRSAPVGRGAAHPASAVILWWYHPPPRLRGRIRPSVQPPWPAPVPHPAVPRSWCASSTRPVGASCT
jgi:hypothetical protein